ncbi:MAG: ferredoxin [Elusimicrobiota bacterium]
MRLRIDTEGCIGCGLCVQLSPEMFEMAENVAVVKMDNVPADRIDNIKETIESCPVIAIIAVEE